MANFHFGNRARPPAAAALLVALCAAAPVAAQDVRFNQLEQDVRELQRVVQAQRLRIESLERELARASRPTAPAAARRGAAGEAAARSPADGAWLSAASWERVRTGMSALEVVELLGPPTSMRGRDDANRQLFYALEIGGAGFLGGSVVLRDGRVVEIERPRLR